MVHAWDKGVVHCNKEKGEPDCDLLQYCIESGGAGGFVQGIPGTQSGPLDGSQALEDWYWVGLVCTIKSS